MEDSPQCLIPCPPPRGIPCRPGASKTSGLSLCPSRMILVGKKAHAETPGGEVGETGVPRLPGETAPSRSWLLPTPTSASPKGGLRVEKATRTDRGSQGQDQPPWGFCPPAAPPCLAGAPPVPRPAAPPPGSAWVRAGAARQRVAAWGGRAGRGREGRGGAAKLGSPARTPLPGTRPAALPSRGASGGRRWVEMPAPRASPQPRGRGHRHAAAGARSLRGEADPPSPGCGRV